jgi:hypothetical protein
MINISREQEEKSSLDSLLNQMVIFILDIAKPLDLTSNWLLIMEAILILDMMILILLKRTKNTLIRF